MRLPVAVPLLLSLGFASPLPGQAPGDSMRAPLRIATLTAGLGNAMGWLGVQGERYFSGDRLSAFLGVGYTPSVDQGDPSGVTFAAGLRGFTAGLKHCGFVEASVCQIMAVASFDGESYRLYGPCVQTGYQFASLGGYTWRR